MKKKAKRRRYDPFIKVQRKIARDTLRMATPMVGVMGGMTKEEAREFLKRGYRVADYKRNIARKADVPWQDPDLQAHWQAGFHTAWDEPEDHPQYPMAGDLQKSMMTKAEWDAIQARRRRMYGRKAMNPYSSDYEDDYDAPEAEQCPVCGGEAQFMGTLGKVDWFRCRQCGMESRRQSNPASVAHDVVAVYSTKGGAHQLVVVVEADGCYGIKYIDHQRHTGGSAGLCNQKMLNDKLTELIYWADRIDGIQYELTYSGHQSRPVYGMNPR